MPVLQAGVDDAVEVVAGGSHSCARRSDGTVVCWGYNYLGALGNGSTTPTRATSPQEVVELSDAVALSRATVTKVKQNFFFAFFYNVVAIPLAAAGLLQPWMAAAAMGLSDICVIGNALLLYRWKRQT